MTAPPRSLFRIFTVAWIIVLVGGALWAIGRNDPTAREQTTVAQAAPVVDRATAAIAGAVVADRQGAASISGFDKVEQCRVTLVRPGVRFVRTVIGVVPSGGERALMDRVAARLPAAFNAVVTNRTTFGDSATDARTEPVFTADAGFYVAITGRIADPGQVRFDVDTGVCRPAGDLPAASAAGGPSTVSGPEAPVGLGSRPADAARAVATHLHAPVDAWRVHKIACAGGATLTTVEAQVGAEPSDLDTAMAGFRRTGVLVTEPRLYAQQDDDFDIVVRPADGHLLVTASTRCH